MDIITGGEVTSFNNGHITASGIISSSSEVRATNLRFDQGNSTGIILNGASKPIISLNAAGVLTFGAVHSSNTQHKGVNIHVTGSSEVGLFLDTAANVTASGNISASGAITSSGLNLIGSGTAELEVEGHITASGNISASVATSGSGGNYIGNRRFDKTSNTDATHLGDIVYFGGTVVMSPGRIYHYKSDGTWESADADAASTSDGLLAVALGTNSDVDGMLLRGTVTLDHDPGAVSYTHLTLPTIYSV